MLEDAGTYRARRAKEAPARILLVDDDADVREALVENLEQASYEVACASDGEEALKYLRLNPPPAAILLDLFMPVMDGWEFLKRVTGDSRLAAVPVVVVTAAGEHWGYPVPPALIVRKPVDLDRLILVLRGAIKSQG